MAQNTWAVSRRVFSKMPNGVEHFLRHFRWILSTLDKESILEWTVITWSLWIARNQFIFHKSQQRPEFIRDQGLDLLKTFQSASGGPPGAWSQLFLFGAFVLLMCWSLSSLTHCFQPVFLSDLSIPGLNCCSVLLPLCTQCLLLSICCFKSIKLSITFLKKKKKNFSLNLILSLSILIIHV